MLTVSEKANQVIVDFLKAQENPSHIRLFLNEGG